MNQIIEKANTVFKKVDGMFFVIKSRLGDLSETEPYTFEFVNNYINTHDNVIVL